MTVCTNPVHQCKSVSHPHLTNSCREHVYSLHKSVHKVCIQVQIHESFISYTLTHTATHCDTLRQEHTAAHCNTLRHTAAPCITQHRNTLRHTATKTHCNTLQHTATYCSTVHHTTLLLQHTATRERKRANEWLLTRALHISRTDVTNTCSCNVKACTNSVYMGVLCASFLHGSSKPATHYNALQQTATHCNTLQQEPGIQGYPCVSPFRMSQPNCNALQHTATHCNTCRHCRMTRIARVYTVTWQQITPHSTT